MAVPNAKALERSRREYLERMKANPNPTQDECDRIKLGEGIFHKERSGTVPEPEPVATPQALPEPPISQPPPEPEQTRAMEATRPGGYQTRAMRAERAEKPTEKPAEKSGE